eukprot:1176767-Prorocentrum_minimum.AAC.2
MPPMSGPSKAAETNTTPPKRPPYLVARRSPTRANTPPPRLCPTRKKGAVPARREGGGGRGVSRVGSVARSLQEAGGGSVVWVVWPTVICPTRKKARCLQEARREAGGGSVWRARGAAVEISYGMGALSSRGV